MNANSANESSQTEFASQARAFAENLAKRETSRNVLADMVENQPRWAEFRMVRAHHLQVWQDYTIVTLGVAPEGLPMGWMVESRKQTCGQPILSDVDVENRARTVPQILPVFRLQGVRREAIDDHRSMAVAAFIGPGNSAGCEVYINHTTGEIVGFLPVPTGVMKPVPLDDPGAKVAETLAWQQIEKAMTARSGSEAAKMARQAFKLTALNTLRDPEGTEFRKYRLWRYYSICDVGIDETTKEIVSWYMEALQADAPHRRITEDAAVQVARTELKATDGVQGPKIYYQKTGDNENVTVYWWHAEEGVNVEGDQTTVLVNAATGKVFSVARKWRKISRELFKPLLVTEAEALKAADKATHRNAAGPDGKVSGKNIIQISSQPNGPGGVRDVLVWRVGYQETSRTGFTEVSVDCKTGEVVRITGW